MIFENKKASSARGATMLGIVGIIVFARLLIFLAYRGSNVILMAPICAGVALLFSWGEAPLLASYTQTFMPALGNYLAKFFPLFMLGAIFGKLMDDWVARAHRALDRARTGKKRAILAIVLGLRHPDLWWRVAVRRRVLGLSDLHLDVSRGGRSEAADTRGHRAWFLHIHDDRAARYAGDPERDPDALLRHHRRLPHPGLASSPRFHVRLRHGVA